MCVCAWQNGGSTRASWWLVGGNRTPILSPLEAHLVVTAAARWASDTLTSAAGQPEHLRTRTHATRDYFWKLPSKPTKPESRNSGKYRFFSTFEHQFHADVNRPSGHTTPSQISVRLTTVSASIPRNTTHSGYNATAMTGYVCAPYRYSYRRQRSCRHRSRRTRGRKSRKGSSSSHALGHQTPDQRTCRHAHTAV